MPTRMWLFALLVIRNLYSFALTIIIFLLRFINHDALDQRCDDCILHRQWSNGYPHSNMWTTGTEGTTLVDNLAEFEDAGFIRIWWRTIYRTRHQILMKQFLQFLCRSNHLSLVQSPCAGSSVNKLPAKRKLPLMSLKCRRWRGIRKLLAGLNQILTSFISTTVFVKLH